MEPVLWTYIDRLTENTQKIFLNLLKLNPELRQKTLSWLGSCLKANSDRAKLWNAQAPELNPVTYSSASDAFMINFSNVLLRLCNPFCANIEDRKILKVDPTYCAVPVSCSIRCINIFYRVCQNKWGKIRDWYFTINETEN